MRLPALAAASALLIAASVGCHKKEVKPPPKFDPEANSGPDGKRAGAMPMDINKQYTDSVDYDKADRSDWRFLELKGTPGPLEVELHWDNAPADVTVDVFDGIGVQIATSPPSSGQRTKRLSVPIEEMGTYYIRVQAPKAGSTSDYTVEAKWEGEAPPPPPVVEPKPKIKTTPHSPRPHKASRGSPENALQGRIASAHAESGGTVLYLDKGAAAGVAEGQNGWILVGGSGFDVLEGGTFTITRVVDDGRSVAKTSLKSIGRNTRIAINTGK